MAPGEENGPRPSQQKITPRIRMSWPFDDGVPACFLPGGPTHAAEARLKSQFSGGKTGLPLFCIDFAPSGC